jgi:predicted nucleic acid-binding protein
MGGIISVQVLNEFASVAPLTIETHDRATQLAEPYSLSGYDALIVSTALLAGCATLYSEDMRQGRAAEFRCHVQGALR